MKKLNFFCSPNAPYYIYGLDYRQSSAGIRVLHYLCHALNESGEEAYISTDVTTPYLRAPRLTNKVISRHAQAGRLPIAVYPEIVAGNPFQAQVVARWLLNKPGHLGGEAFYELNEMLFVYQATYAPEGAVTHPLYIPAVDGRIFNNADNARDGSRKGACYYAHKYLVFGGVLTHHAAGATSLCQDVALSHEEIADALRRSEVLYCYEPSAIVTEALHCGCPVVIIPSDYIAKHYDYQFLRGPGVEIAFDDNALALVRAKETLKEFDVQIHYVHAELTLRNFVDLTQKEMAVRLSKLKALGDGAALPRVAEVQERKLSDYDLWRISRSAYKAMVPADEDATFHIAVFAPAGSATRLSATLASISKQHHVRCSVSILSGEQAPSGFAGGEGVRWVTQERPGSAEALDDIVKSGGFDWLLMLEAGDTLDEHALSTLLAHVAKHPEWAIVYADEDILDEAGAFHTPFFKPDFAIDCYRAAPGSLGGGMAVKSGVLQGMTGFGDDVEGAEQYDLLLRVFEKLGGSAIGHIPDVLFHRDGGGLSPSAQEQASPARRRVLSGHLERIGARADIEAGALPGTFRIRYHHGDSAAVSIIIPTLNGGAVLQSSVNEIVANTAYKNWELIVVDMESDDPDTLAFLNYLRAFNNDAIRVVSHPRPASLPALLNAGARIARQDYLLFLSDSSKPVQSDWLDELLGYAVQPGVGVVGGKGVGQGGTVSSTGYVLGLDGRPAVFPYLHAPLDEPGYFGRLQVPGNPSAVAFTCMLTEKKLFDELGGFDERELAGGYSDADYCLKVGKAGRRVVWTPFALMFQKHTTEPPKEIEADEDDDEVEEKRLWIFPGPAAQAMFDRWLDRIAFDPAYNRNLSLNMYSSRFAAKAFRIETLPPLTWGADNHPEPCILALNGDKTGCGEYRIIAPLRALTNAAKVHGLNHATFLSIPELARMSPDILVFQRPILEEQVKLVELYARYSRAFRVYELDDLITNIQYGNQARHVIQGKDLIKRLRHVVGLCNRLVVSTDYLAQEYRKFKTDIRVVPNYIERARWDGLEPKRRQGRKPRVGWAGSVSHVGDLAVIADVVKALSGEVEWVFLGLCPEGVRNLVEYHSSVPIKDYPAKLASLNLDLAIAPLEDVPFNHAKSHLKLLEYGMLGYPVVCTDMTPYRGAYPVTRVKNRLKHWVDAIREHVSDLDELARRGDALRDYTRANWMLEDNLDRWLKAWLPS